MASRFEQRFQTSVVPAMNRMFGVTAKLMRGLNLSEEITVRRNDREYIAIGAEYGIEIKITMRDFLISVASAVIDGDAIEPRTGDRIIEGDETFEIQPVDEKTPSVELIPGGYEWLCHTKKVE